MGSEKLTKVDSNETDVEKGQADSLSAQKLEKSTRHAHKVDFDTGPAADAAEQPAMLELQKTYGKTIHTWAIDISPELPLGPPNLMVSYTADGQGPPEHMVQKRDEEWGQDTAAKRELRKGYLPPYEKADGADEWEKTGRGVKFNVNEVFQ